jgi:hypothetical protein
MFISNEYMYLTLEYYQEQADRQVGVHYHWAVELEQGPHGLSLALTLPVVFSFEDSGVPPDMVLLEAY